MVDTLIALSKKVYIAAVGGSDYNKILEQVEQADHAQLCRHSRRAVQKDIITGAKNVGAGLLCRCQMQRVHHIVKGAVLSQQQARDQQDEGRRR